MMVAKMHRTVSSTSRLTRAGLLVSLVALAALPASARPAGTALPPSVGKSFSTPIAPAHVAIGFGSVWVTTHRARTLYRLNPRRNQIGRRMGIPFNSCLPLAVGTDRLWVNSCQEGRAAEVSPRRNAVTSLRTGVPYAFGEGAAWTFRQGELVRLDPRTGAATGRVKVAMTSLPAIGAGVGSVWVVDADGGVVVRADPRSLQVVASIELPRYGSNGTNPAGRHIYGGYVAFASGFAWVTGPGALYRIDPATNRAMRLDLGIEGFSEWGDVCITAGRGSIWVRRSDTEIVRVDPETGDVVGRYPAAGGGGCMAVGFGSLWVANFIDSTVWRIRLDD